MYDELFEKDNSEYQYQVINDKDDIRRILDLYVSKYYNFEISFLGFLLPLSIPNTFKEYSF